MPVRFLDQTLINQIAAGEVIERPASAIKELVENAIDAEATRIDVVVRDGGKTLISVTDNGSGMTPDDLALSVERHATSKIPDGDLFNIRTLGFRGEALPSIGSVSRLTITSRPKDGDAWMIVVEGGQTNPVEPSSGSQGTKIEVRDLFYATPARLKFLKTATSELNHITDIIYRQALANPQVDFTLRHDDRSVINFTMGADRLNAILGKDFRDNVLDVNFVREESKLTGWVSIPTYNRSNSTDQYLFVNGRPVKDKLFATALKVAYQDVLAGNRFPCACLFLECDPEDVDINVHPAKAEVRFRDPNLMRGFIIAGVREALTTMASRTSTHLGDKAIMAFDRPVDPVVRDFPRMPTPVQGFVSTQGQQPRLSMPVRSSYMPLAEHKPSYVAPSPSQIATVAQLIHQQEENREDHPLGYAKAQIHETYIVAESSEALILVDQHAAHERLVYERMKADLASGIVKPQALLIPTIIEMTQGQHQAIESVLPSLTQFGFNVESFGDQAIVVREVPSLMIKCNIKQLMVDLATEIMECETTTTIENALHDILADKACKNSIRAGRKLNIEEMNALLREMEKTPSSNQCNHGRPTFIKLSKMDMEKLFERA
ncbi:MAG: DNA mismatch repair endonuclease MutL [Candidatus Paracaedibacteraceae bacterium]|nr:DNA mismatch repair endonuclease MutL [Candidatus Paracaedibacteraceae bacterium]